jgi:RNA polymerase sigma-70 factor (ECF subfamily)
MMDESEHAVYRAALQGDRDAFERVIRSTSRNLFAIAYGILQNREEAEDVVQDSFVKAWKSRWRVRDSAKLPAWLSTIARNKARDLARKRKPEPLPENFEATEVVEVGDAEKWADLNGEVRSALAQLPELHRVALTLRYCEELDYGTIERTLGLTNGALRGILGRALGHMRKRLKPALAAIG